jgi:RecB family exonuclease
MSTSPSNTSPANASPEDASPEDASPEGTFSEGTSLLPEDFRFSQGRLQDFTDCPRRFLLRHIEGRLYPAPEAEPIRENERRKERGVRFHELLCQAHSGVPREAIARLAEEDEQLALWWQRFVDRDPVGAAATTYAEISLEGDVGGYPLTATFDLIAERPGGTFEIFDWKTARHRPARDQLASRLQTTVYPYLLAQAGGGLNGGEPPSPEAIQMTYWYAQHPDDPETFSYSDYNYQADDEALRDQIGRILSRTDRAEFEKTDEVGHCRFCTYRSHCGRGTSAGHIEEGETYLEETGSVETDLEDVEEIEF